jgi:hypothetical protein
LAQRRLSAVEQLNVDAGCAIQQLYVQSAAFFREDHAALASITARLPTTMAAMQLARSFK